MLKEIKNALRSRRSVSHWQCEIKMLLLTVAVICIFCGATELRAKEFKYVASNKQAKVYFFIDYHRNMQQSLSARPIYIYQRVFKALQTCKRNGSFKDFMANEVFFFAPGKSLADREIDSSEIPVFSINKEIKGTWEGVYSSIKDRLPVNAIHCIVSTNKNFEVISQTNFEKNVYFVTINPRGRGLRFSVQDWEKEISEKLNNHKVNELVSSYSKLTEEELKKLNAIQISCTSEIGGIKLEMPRELLKKNMWHWEIKHNDKEIEKIGTVAVVEGGNKISVAIVSPLGDRYVREWNFTYRKLNSAEKSVVDDVKTRAKELKVDIEKEITDNTNKLDLLWANDATAKFMEVVDKFKKKLDNTRKINDIEQQISSKYLSAIRKEIDEARKSTGTKEFEDRITKLREAVKELSANALNSCKGDMDKNLTDLFKDDFNKLNRMVEEANFKDFYQRLDIVRQEIKKATVNLAKVQELENSLDKKDLPKFSEEFKELKKAVREQNFNEKFERLKKIIDKIIGDVVQKINQAKRYLEELSPELKKLFADKVKHLQSLIDNGQDPSVAHKELKKDVDDHLQINVNALNSYLSTVDRATLKKFAENIQKVRNLVRDTQKFNAAFKKLKKLLDTRKTAWENEKVLNDYLKLIPSNKKKQCSEDIEKVRGLVEDTQKFNAAFDELKKKIKKRLSDDEIVKIKEIEVGKRKELFETFIKTLRYGQTAFQAQISEMRSYLRDIKNFDAKAFDKKFDAFKKMTREKEISMLKASFEQFIQKLPYAAQTAFQTDISDMRSFLNKKFAVEEFDKKFNAFKQKVKAWYDKFASVKKQNLAELNKCLNVLPDQIKKDFKADIEKVRKLAADKKFQKEFSGLKQKLGSAWKTSKKNEKLLDNYLKKFKKAQVNKHKVSINGVRVQSHNQQKFNKAFKALKGEMEPSYFMHIIIAVAVIAGIVVWKIKNKKVATITYNDKDKEDITVEMSYNRRINLSSIGCEKSIVVVCKKGDDDIEFELTATDTPVWYSTFGSSSKNKLDNTSVLVGEGEYMFYVAEQAMNHFCKVQLQSKN